MATIEIPHGTRAGYAGTRNRDGCRCQSCLEANREYLQDRIRVATHGKLSTYTMGCRCESCKGAQRAYHQKYKNRPEYRAPLKRVSAWLASLKAKPCADCGGTFPPECMDFDHVRGEKEFTIAHLAKAVKNVEKIRAEIAKCDLVCANCHRIRTRARRTEQ